MDIQDLKEAAAAGKLSSDMLIDIIVAQQERIAELEDLLKANNI